jgi:hypothetical protein
MIALLYCIVFMFGLGAFVVFFASQDKRNGYSEIKTELSGFASGLFVAAFIALTAYGLSCCPPQKGSAFDKSEPKVVKTVAN